MLVVRWSGFAVPPVLLSSEQLFTDRAGPVQSKFPVIKFVIIAGYYYKHAFTDSPLATSCGHGIPPIRAVIEA